MNSLDAILERIRAEHGGRCAAPNCNSEPAPMGIYCEPCQAIAEQRRFKEERERAEKERRKIIAEALQRVTSSAPQWSHARIGSPVYLSLSGLLRAWVEGFDGRESACILGPSGTGKTTALRAWLSAQCQRAYRAAVERGFRDPLYRHTKGILWTTGHALASARKRHALGSGEAPLVEQAESASLLLLDELGFEPRTEVVFEVLDARYAAGLPTVVTSGLTAKGFADRERGYGDALFRRLTDNGVGQLIDLWEKEKQ